VDEYTKQLIESARAPYEDVVIGNESRIQRGKVLWDQVEAAADACRTGGKDREQQLCERINDLAVAKVLSDDKQPRGPIMSPTCCRANARSILSRTGYATISTSR
jgi:hypothetical protein